MIGQSCEHVGEPRPGINIIEFAGLNQGVGSSSAMPSGVRTCEGPVSPAHGGGSDGDVNSGLHPDQCKPSERTADADGSTEMGHLVFTRLQPEVLRTD